MFHHAGYLMEIMTSYQFLGPKYVVSIKVVRILIVILESYILQYYNPIILPSRNDTIPTMYPKFHSILILCENSTRSHKIIRSYDT